MARTLRIRSITPGKMVGGRFIPNPKRTMKLGKGGRFRKLEAEIAARGGAYDPQAVAAAIGMRKYGKKRMEAWAHKARNARRGSPTLAQALRRRGFTYRKGRDEQRQDIYDRSGRYVGSFTAAEAWAWLRSRKHNPESVRVVVYQDTDALGKREWYGYLKLESGHGSGHIIKNFGPFKTKSQAERAGKRLIPKHNRRRNRRRK